MISLIWLWLIIPVSFLLGVGIGASGDSKELKIEDPQELPLDVNVIFVDDKKYTLKIAIDKAIEDSANGTNTIITVAAASSIISSGF